MHTLWTDLIHCVVLNNKISLQVITSDKNKPKLLFTFEKLDHIHPSFIYLLIVVPYCSVFQLCSPRSNALMHVLEVSCFNTPDSNECLIIRLLQTLMIG